MKKLITLLMALVFTVPSLFAYSVDFYFQDGEDDIELDNPGSLVNIWNLTEEEPVSITQPYYMPYGYGSVTMLRISADDYDYEVSVEVQNADLDGYNLEKDGNEWYLTLFPDADGGEVYITVYLAGQAPGGSQISEVTTRFNISAKSGSGITNPSDFITISYFDRSVFQDVTVGLDDNFGSAAVAPGTSFTLTPADGYELSVSTFSDGIASISAPGDGDKEWYISISETPAEEDVTFFVEVAKSEEAGPTGPSTVTFYFNDMSSDFSIENPQECVYIWNTTGESEVVPSSMVMPFEYSGETTLIISSNDVEMYRVEVAPDTFEFDSIEEFNNSGKGTIEDQDGSWWITLQSAANGLEFYVRVYPKDASAEVTSRFNISAKSGSGIANPSDFVTISYFDRSVFQDVTVELNDDFGSATVAPGTTFTLTPADGYELTVTTFSEGVASISEPGDDSNAWNIAISETPAAEDAAFFVEVAKTAADTPPITGPEYAEVTQLKELTWKIEWTDYDYIDPLYSIIDEVPTLTNLETGKAVSLKFGRRMGNEITVKGQLYYDFNTSCNYLTLELDGMNLADGKYELMIPAGYVNLGKWGVSGKTSCPQQLLSIIIGEEVPELDYPVHIGELETNAFDITWENVFMLEPGETTGAYIQNTETNEKYDMLFLEGELYSKANLMINGAKLRVNLTNNYPELPNGMYKFYLPANYVKFNGSDTGNEVIDNVMLDFYYWREGPIVGDGPTEDGLYTVTWTSATEISYNTAYAGDAQSGIRGVVIFDANDNLLNIPQANLTFSGNKMTVNLNGLDLPSGGTSLVIPEDCIYVTIHGERDLTFGATLRFDYYNPNRPPVDPDEEYQLWQGQPTWSIKENGDVVYKGTLVTVTWGDYKLTYNDEVDDEAGLRASLNIGWLGLEFGKEVKISEDGYSLVFDFSTLPTALYDTFYVPEAYVSFEVDGVKYYNTSTLLYNVFVDNSGTGGISGIEADNGRYVVYSISGVKVLETENASDLNSLPKGLYIINGKKVVK